MPDGEQADSEGKAAFAETKAAAVNRGVLQPSLLLAPLFVPGEMPPALNEFTVESFVGVPLPSVRPIAARGGGVGDGASDAATPTANAKNGNAGRGNGSGPLAKGVAPRELPRLAELVHGNCTAIAKIIDQFQEGTPEGLPKPSRAQIEKEIRAMATRGRMSGVGNICWSVRPDMLDELGIRTPASSHPKPADDAAKQAGLELPMPTMTEVQNQTARNFLHQEGGVCSGTPGTSTSTSAVDGEDAVRF